MKYRSRIDIIAMILRSATRGATKTRTMYDAYLSHIQANEYLGFLLENGLLVHEEGTPNYSISEKGRHVLLAYDGISEMMCPGRGEPPPASARPAPPQADRGAPAADQPPGGDR